MTVGDVLVFWEILQQNDILKKKFREAKTDLEVEKIIRESSFAFSAEEFYMVAREIPEAGGLAGGPEKKPFSFCEGCSDKGTSFCLTSCFWAKV